MRYTGPRAKKARRLGQAFTEKEAKIMQRRPTPPGQHGANRARLSEFGTQLKEKQKAKFAYGILERQFSNYFKKALSMPGVTGQNLLRLLESRIDNVVYRLGFATTRAQARQMVSHGFFNVNGKKVTIPSYTLKVGDIISVVDRKANSKIILSLKEKISSFTPLDWLDLNTSDLKAKVLSQPNLEEMEKLINTQLIVEHYSRI